MRATKSESILTQIADWAVSLMDLIGAPGAGLAVALENLFPPIPSEVILPLAGLAASRGSFTLAEALLWTTVGSVVGAYLLYALGALLGAGRLSRIAERVPLLHAADVERTVAWFHRHGRWAVFFGRMLPVFRSLISIPAGVSRMPLWQFGLMTMAGSFLWNTIFILAGYFLGENWHVVERYSSILQYVVLVALALGILWFILRRVQTSRRQE